MQTKEEALAKLKKSKSEAVFIWMRRILHILKRRAWIESEFMQKIL